MNYKIFAKATPRLFVELDNPDEMDLTIDREKAMVCTSWDEAMSMLRITERSFPDQTFALMEAGE